jgi:hypothetical protein
VATESRSSVKTHSRRDATFTRRSPGVHAKVSGRRVVHVPYAAPDPHETTLLSRNLCILCAVSRPGPRISGPRSSRRARSGLSLGQAGRGAPVATIDAIGARLQSHGDG